MTQPALPTLADDLVLRIIGAHDGEAPAPIAYLQHRTGLSARQIKQIVSDARKRGLPICSRKSEPCGYWWATTNAEIQATAERLRREARDVLWTVGRMLGSEAALAILGQLRLELEQEKQA